MECDQLDHIKLEPFHHVKSEVEDHSDCRSVEELGGNISAYSVKKEEIPEFLVKHELGPDESGLQVHDGKYIPSKQETLIYEREKYQYPVKRTSDHLCGSGMPEKIHVKSSSLSYNNDVPSASKDRDQESDSDESNSETDSSNDDDISSRGDDSDCYGVNFVCPVCQEIFKEQAMLDEHKNSAHVEKEKSVDFVCRVCEEVFDDQILLAEHCKSMHDLFCKICGIVSFSRELHKKHYWKSHPGHSVCYVCNIVFKNRSLLVRHCQGSNQRWHRKLLKDLHLA